MQVSKYQTHSSTLSPPPSHALSPSLSSVCVFFFVRVRASTIRGFPVHDDKISSKRLFFGVETVSKI